MPRIDPERVSIAILHAQNQAYRGGSCLRVLAEAYVSLLKKYRARGRRIRRLEQCHRLGISGGPHE